MSSTGADLAQPTERAREAAAGLRALQRALAIMGLACVGAAALPATASAQAPADGWKYRAIVYGYFPDIGGTTTFPESIGGGTGSAKIDSSTLLDSLNFAFMGTFEATKGRFGILADVLYMDVSGSASKTRDLRIDGHELPVGVTANADLGLRGTVFELAGTYKVVQDPKVTVDVLAGTRLLDLRQTLTLELSADIGNDTGPGRSRQSSVHPTYWDAVVGAKGQFLFGARGEWFVPWYLDVGTGESKLTYQAIGGLGYSFSWGQVIAAWRYLDYEFKSGSNVESLDFNGPMVGVAFSW